MARDGMYHQDTTLNKPVVGLFIGVLQYTIYNQNIIGWDGSHREGKNIMQTLQELWANTMQELGIFDDIVEGFDSVGSL